MKPLDHAPYISRHSPSKTAPNTHLGLLWSDVNSRLRLKAGSADCSSLDASNWGCVALKEGQSKDSVNYRFYPGINFENPRLPISIFALLSSPQT